MESGKKLKCMKKIYQLARGSNVSSMHIRTPQKMNFNDYNHKITTQCKRGVEMHECLCKKCDRQQWKHLKKYK